MPGFPPVSRKGLVYFTMHWPAPDLTDKKVYQISNLLNLLGILKRACLFSRRGLLSRAFSSLLESLADSRRLTAPAYP